MQLSEVSATQVLDTARLADLFGDGESDWSEIVELIDLYLDDADRLVTTLGTALARDSRPELRRAAHSLSGASRSIGANELATVAAALEEWAITDTPGSAPATAADLETALARTRHALEVERSR